MTGPASYKMVFNFTLHFQNCIFQTRKYFLLFYFWMFPEISILEVNIYCFNFPIMNSRGSVIILRTEIFEEDSRRKR